jgi:putative glutathione S-transferase
VLWDKAQRTIVSNESSEIIRMFNGAFDHLGAREGDFYPPPLREAIDGLNEWIYNTVNNGVYRCGFATSQQAYEEALGPLFATLDALEERLASRRYLMASTLAEADWCLFTTLVRFDPVYVGHFKCNLRRLVDYPHLFAYTRDLFQVPRSTSLRPMAGSTWPQRLIEQLVEQLVERLGLIEACPATMKLAGRRQARWPVG